VVRLTLRPLYLQGKRHRCPLDRRLSEPQSRSGCGGEKKKSMLLPVIEPQSNFVEKKEKICTQFPSFGKRSQ
jgi:hypothetical protein